MTDQEMTRLCAEARGLTPRTPTLKKQFNERIFEFYNPLHDDAQAMALVKKFGLRIVEAPEGGGAEVWEVVKWDWRSNEDEVCAENVDLNRAIVECVARMQKYKR